MLGVLKRRWKPKRASNGNRLSNDSVVNGDIKTIVSNVELGDKPPLRSSALSRQVHPLCDEKKTQLIAYENVKDGGRDSNHQSTPYVQTNAVYPLTPNICVEGGRIEFIKTSPDVETGAPPFGGVAAQPRQSPERVRTSPSLIRTSPTHVRTSSVHGARPAPPPRAPQQQQQQQPPPLPKRNSTTSVCSGVRSPDTVTRSQQTVDAWDDCDNDEKFDIAKESFEERVAELEIALQNEQRASQKDKLCIAKLQRQLSRRESAVRDASRERRLRADSDLRARDACAELGRCRQKLKLLTQEFAKMEESVREMLVYKSRAEQLKQEKASLNLAYETRSRQYQATITRLTQEVSSLRQQLDTISKPGNRIASLESDNAALAQEVQEARKQYERCLDDVANEVVRALLSQKTLREEIATLTRRIRELETQNRALTSLLVQQLRTGSTPSSAMITPSSAQEQLALESGGSTHDGLCATTFSSPGSVYASTSPIDAEYALISKLKHSNSFNFDRKSRLDKRFSTGDLISSYNERVLPTGDLVACITEKRLSADVIDTSVDTRLSLEDKKRHQVFTELWTDLQGAEVTPQKLLNALDALEPGLWMTEPAKRPATLDLAIPAALQATSHCSHRRSKPVVAQLHNKAEEEPGTESPESGNRDEGYSTMSSDVQGDVNRSQGEQTTRGLEDLAEVTDETETQPTENRLVVVEDCTNPDIFFIPINLALKINPRNSYPPTKDLLPFQHVMRSFSDSHLCLKITTAPSPCYSLSSPLSSTPSVLLLDVNPLRRTRANASLAPVDSWGSNLDIEPLAGSPWDNEYIQHWLKLDETRTNIQQRHREVLELEYDRAELEDWSLSLSTEDVRETGSNNENIQTPGQISTSTLPSIQECNALDLEEDVSECLWNDSSYLTDRASGELVTLLVDTDSCQEVEISWPYVNHDVTSPPESWSSISEDDPCSKRSSAALSGYSDEAPLIGTDFTRDFYRLVKFESTKSLASCSSKGAGQHECIDHDQALQSVLNFIAEQHLYCQSQEHRDSRPTSARDFDNDGLMQSRPDDHWSATCDSTEPLVSDSGSCDNFGERNHSSLDDDFVKREQFSDSENYVNIKHLQTELVLNEQNALKDIKTANCVAGSGKSLNSIAPVEKTDPPHESSKQSVKPQAIAPVPPIDLITNQKLVNGTNAMETGCAVDKQNNSVANVCKNSSDAINTSVVSGHQNVVDSVCESARTGNLSGLGTVIEEEECTSPSTTMSQSLSSSVSTPDTIVSRIPRRPKSSIKQTAGLTNKVSPKPSKTIVQQSDAAEKPICERSESLPTTPKTSEKCHSKPSSPCKTATTTTTTSPKRLAPTGTKSDTTQTAKASPKSRIPFKQKSTVVHLVKKRTEQQSQPVITSEHLPQFASALPSCSIIEGPPHCAVSFHERATSKDVIDELNRMIRKGEDGGGGAQDADEKVAAGGLDVACCCPTGWVHVEKDIDFNDPKARANLLDVMLASSDSSPTSSCGGSVSSDSIEDHSDYKHLHRLHRYRRQKKESNSAPCTPSTETAV